MPRFFGADLCSASSNALSSPPLSAFSSVVFPVMFHSVKDQDHRDVDFPGTPPSIHDQVHRNASSSVNDFSIDPRSRLGIVLNAAIPQSLNLQLAEGNALEVLWQDSTRFEIIHLHVSSLIL